MSAAAFRVRLTPRGEVHGPSLGAEVLRVGQEECFGGAGDRSCHEHRPRTSTHRWPPASELMARIARHIQTDEPLC